MNIAFYSEFLPPELSGITDTILITGKELAKRGHHVAYVGPRYSKREYAVVHKEMPRSDVPETIAGIPIVRIPSVSMPNSPTRQSRIAFPIGASFPFMHDFKPDIIHLQGPFGTGFEAIRAARRFKIPLVGTNHTPIEEFSPPGTKGIMRRYDAWFYNHCDYVTTPASTLLASMKNAGFRKEGQTMPNPALIDIFRMPHADEKIEAKQQLGVTGPVILYVGRLAKEKRVDLLIEAVARLKKEFEDSTLVATGQGLEEEKLKALAAKLGIQKNVRFTGFLSSEQLVREYHAADIFSMMSEADTQSLSLMQAYAAGVPAVTARSKGFIDYVPENVGFLVEPKNVDELVAHLRQLLRDIPLRERMGKAANAYVLQFAPDKVAEAWEEIYKKAIAAKFQTAASPQIVAKPQIAAKP